MSEFIVRSIDPTRGQLRQTIAAADAQDAVARLDVPPRFVLSIEAVRPSTPTRAGRRVRAFPLRLFSQELAVLLGAGIPLLEALVTLREKEASTGVASAMDDVIERVRSGQAFSAALRARPEAFDPLFVAVVQSSERTGQTERALREHAAYLAWVDSLRGTLVGASVYPVTLLVAGLAVIVFLLLFVVPRFAGVLEGVSTDLPLASRILIEIGQIGGQHPLATILAATLLFSSPVLAWRYAPLRRWFIVRLWRLPLLGPKLHVLALAQFYRTCSMLLEAGVPGVQALQTARHVVSDRLRESLDEAIGAVDRGERMSNALQRAQLATPVSLRMIRVGERSGNLGQMLRKAADFYDEELIRLTDLVTRLVNPLLMLMMGVVIGSIVVLMYLPIFQLVEQVQ